MSSRDDILASIRTNLPRVDRPLPYVPLFDDDAPASLLDACAGPADLLDRLSS